MSEKTSYPRSQDLKCYDGKLRTLKEYLEDWEDSDVAAFCYGAVLGLWPNTYAAWQANKYRFWSQDPLGDELYKQLEFLAEQKVLEFDLEDSRYRWIGQHT